MHPVQHFQIKKVTFSIDGWYWWLCACDRYRRSIEVEDANNVVDNDDSDTIGSFGLLLDEFDDYYVATGEEECDFVL